jgi:hypothetical protein
MDMRFSMWNVRNLNRACSLRIAAHIKSKYKLLLVGVQEVTWGKGGTESEIIYFSMEIGMKSYESGTGFFVQENHITT